MKLTCYQVDAGAPTLVPGYPDREWMEKFSHRHPYRCLPLVVANSSGWELQSPVAFKATWNGGPLATDIVLEPTDDTKAEQLQRWAQSHFGGGVLTFHTGYLFHTSEGWDIWTGGSPNYVKDGIQPLVGVVETWWLPFPFTMNWHFTRPGTISFAKGEPYCFIMPIPHHALDEIEPVVKPIESNAELFQQYQAWGQSRSKFIDDLKNREEDAVKRGWQRDYFQGRSADGSVSDNHIHRRRLKPPRKE
jgi:Family of unknown function (DUF6065)